MKCFLPRPAECEIQLDQREKEGKRGMSDREMEQISSALETGAVYQDKERHMKHPMHRRFRSFAPVCRETNTFSCRNSTHLMPTQASFKVSFNVRCHKSVRAPHQQGMTKHWLPRPIRSILTGQFDTRGLMWRWRTFTTCWMCAMSVYPVEC